MARSAAASCAEGTKSQTSFWVFSFRLWLIGVAHQLVQWRHWASIKMGGEAANFEVMMQRTMENQMEDKLGIKFKMQADENWESISG
jgi:hypothetical protein